MSTLFDLRYSLQPVALCWRFVSFCFLAVCVDVMLSPLRCFFPWQDVRGPPRLTYVRVDRYIYFVAAAFSFLFSTCFAPSGGLFARTGNRFRGATAVGTLLRCSLL